MDDGEPPPRPIECSRSLALRLALVAAVAFIAVGNHWNQPSLAPPPELQQRQPQRPAAGAAVKGLLLLAEAPESPGDLAEEAREVQRAREQDEAELRGEGPAQEQGQPAEPEQRHSRIWRRVERESRGNLEWEVVFNKPVNIRSEKTLTAPIVGVRHQGEVVIGKQQGEWLALSHEPGYIKRTLRDPPTTLLQGRNTSYVQISKGTCAEVKRSVILDPSICRSAAASLGYKHRGLDIYDGDEPQPEGCFVGQGQVWLSRNRKNMGRGAMGDKRPLCSSSVYPNTFAA